MDCKTDYLLEKELYDRSRDLHNRFKSSVVVLTQMLKRYLQIFPNFTDHTELHSMNVIAFCNGLIGTKRIKELNEDEIYVLLMSCYLHDIGMGVSKEDYHDFLKMIDSRYMPKHIVEDDMQTTVRKMHNELSGLFIKKYADLFDIPSEKHVFAITQISRGHRKTDLNDAKEYPAELKLENGNIIHLPYLSALIRLADEIDVAADRNPTLLYCVSDYTDECDIIAFSTHEAIKTLRIEPDEFVLEVDTEEEWVIEEIEDLTEKMQETLDYCNEVTNKHSTLVIDQKRIRIERINV